MPNQSSLRRLLGTAFLCSSLAFATAAAPPSPAPSPLPPAGIETMPVVVVYPFDVQTGVDPRLGSAIAQILAQEMAAAGGISVLPVANNIKRADFLDNARAARADFYISGYVTPVGDRASVVEQVVSVESGVILFSQTAQVATVADVASQSLLAREQILAFVGRGTENVETQPSNTPAPTSTNGAQVPLSGLSSIVNSVFKHKGSSHSPTPAPSVKPSRGIIVAPVIASGPVARTDLSTALRELYFALNTRFKTQMTTIATSVAQSADQICGANRDNTIAAGTLQESAARHRPQMTFNLTVYTCFGAVLEHQVGKGSTVKSAVDAAVNAYAQAHPDNS
jgi:TolB-like protein